MDDLGLQFRFSKPPSYLRELLRQEEEICLAYNKKVKSPVAESSISFSDESPPVSQKTNDFDSTNLDLTGCPLKVDLYGDTLSSTFIFDRPNNWTDEEISHIPVTLNEARKFINQYNRTRAKQAVYCVCDGSDKKQTVILGAKVSKSLFMRCQVLIVGIFPYGHNNLTVDYMKEKHLKNVGVSDAAIKCSITSNFSIYGYNLLNCPAFVNIENRGSILLEVSWDKPTYKIPKTKADYKITLQVIVGHTDSQADALWTEINFLDYCISLSKKQHLENAKLHLSGDCLEVLTDEVNDVFSKQFTRRLRNQKEQETLDFKNLRDTDVVDGLWSVLRKSQTVSDLRACFHYIFEYLAESNLKIHIPENSNSTFISIIRGISSGKIAVPTLTFNESLELLIEHGLEKLKNDYLCVINHFCSVPSEALMSDWHKLSTISPKETHQSKMSIQPACSRKTRMTFNLATSGNEIVNTKKLEHLARMHVIVEFFLLVQNHSEFPSKCYQYIGECALNKYMGPDSPIQAFSALERSKLCDLTLTVDCIDASIIKDSTPVKFHIQMTSTHNKSEVTTIFLHSESPIFPTVVFNNYDLSLSYADGKLYYLTELIQYTQFLM